MQSKCACGYGPTEMCVFTRGGTKFFVCRPCAAWWQKVNPRVLIICKEDYMTLEVLELPTEEIPEEIAPTEEDAEDAS